MSNEAVTVEQPCQILDGCGVVAEVVVPRDRDLGGFSVRRVLPSAGRRAVGPWIFFDHMGPAHFPAGTGINVRPHPHINLATVTYLFEGEILHRDSLGSLQAIRPGDINLMVAGRGIVHSERERAEITAVDHSLHGLQLWLALPEADEEVEPAFHHYPGAQIPALTVNDVPVRVMMGSAWGATSPVRTFGETLYAEAFLQAGQTLPLPEARERAVYMASGEAVVGDSRLAEHAMAVLSPGGGATLVAAGPCRIGIIGGDSLGHRFMDWNFVSSRQARIEQARSDWREGRFATVPGDDVEFMPLPDE